MKQTKAPWCWSTRDWYRLVRDPDSDCWEWQGARSPEGYGRVHGRAYVHRLVYEAVVGPIPAGYEMDHLCRNRICANPSHLEPVTHQENQRRGMSPMGKRSRQTHCIYGHPLDAANTRIRKEGWRVCRTCHRERQRAYSARRPA